MSKKLNITGITNELSEGSAFFRPHKPQPPNQAKSPPPPPVTPPGDAVSPPQKTPAPQSSYSVPERPNARTGEHPQARRIITRNSFEIYEDQMDALRKLSFEEKMQGKLGSMSHMVREAIDTYLRHRATGK